MGHPDETVQQPADDEPTRAAFREMRKSRWERRKERIRNEVDRNRRGEYKVPTWVLSVILIVIVVSWVTLVAVA